MAQYMGQANIDQLGAWKAAGNTGDLPVGWQSSSSGGGGGGQPDYATQRKIALEAVQPSIDSLQASLPEISAKYQSAQTQVGAEKQPLRDRYEQLLNEIRGRETSQVKDVSRTANREFARRGITADSTFAAEETQGRTQPIRSAAQSDILSTTFDREAKLREIDNTITTLSTDMITAERDVRNTIANIQATAGTDAANRALEMYKIQRQEQQSALDRALQARQITAQESATASSSALDAAKFAESIRQFNVGQANKGTGVATTSGGVSYYGNTANTVNTRPTYVGKVGSMDSSGQWYQTNDGWAKVVD